MDLSGAYVPLLCQRVCLWFMFWKETVSLQVLLTLRRFRQAFPLSRFENRNAYSSPLYKLAIVWSNSMILSIHRTIWNVQGCTYIYNIYYDICIIYTMTYVYIYTMTVYYDICIYIYYDIYICILWHMYIYIYYDICIYIWYHHFCWWNPPLLLKKHPQAPRRSASAGPSRLSPFLGALLF